MSNINTGSGLTIPEEAMRAACDAYDSYMHEEGEWRTRERGLATHAEVVALRAAAPLIVAANMPSMRQVAMRLTLLAQAIRGEACIAARPGQLQRLEQMADEIDQAAAELRPAEVTG